MAIATAGAVVPAAASPDTPVTTAPIARRVAIAINRSRTGHRRWSREHGHRQRQRQRQAEVKAEANSGMSRQGCRTEQRGHDNK